MQKIAVLLSLVVPLVILPACASTPADEDPSPRPDRTETDEERALTPAEEAAIRVERVEIRPAPIEVRTGESLDVEVLALDADGEVVEGAEIGRIVQGRAAAYRAAEGRVEGMEPGEASLIALLERPARDGEPADRVVERVPIHVRPLPVARVEVEAPEEPLFAGTRLRLEARAYSEERSREDADFRWESSEPRVATVNRHGLVQALAPGTARVTVTAEGVSASVRLEVVESPVRGVEIIRGEGLEEDGTARVGDVIHFDARALDDAGEVVEGAPVEWSVLGPPLPREVNVTAHLDDDGTFVAEAPGLYRITATAGNHTAVTEVEARPRPPRKPMRKVGHGVVSGRTTSDLWVFEGVDGRDYAYTGTHADGRGGNVMYAWDVTDPSEPVITDSVVVDARVVNDVKINETRNLAVITREGASDRRNGIVILDIRVPSRPRVLSSHTENLTAGVHNTWVEGELVYAVNNGTRDVHIIDISDPANPREVGRWGLDSQDRYLHDVGVWDGLAYLSYWDDGLVILDVGKGIAGGTPTEPVKVSQYSYTSRWGDEEFGNTHHAYPYGDYVFVGDEIFGCSECVNGPRGHVHVIDVSDLENPKEVAWFRVPEAGTHNLWVEDDRLYIAYYQGGLRVVDVSGELRGDLYRQGREIGWFMTESEEGFRPNSAMAWGPQPFKGKIFVSDLNSGLWVVEFAD